MKIAVKLTKKLPKMNYKPYIYYLREAEATILTQLPNDEIARISQYVNDFNIRIKVGEKISGKSVLLFSDMAASEPKIGIPEVISGRHKRQYVKIKSQEKCISTSSTEGIECVWPKKN